MPNRGRTIMYFDNSNIFRSQRQVGWKIDVHKLLGKLQQNGEIWQTHFFAAVTEPPRYMQTSFYRMLKEQLHWETYIFPLGRKSHRCDQCGQRWMSWAEKGVDVALATRLLTHAINRAFDTALVVSGDKDYLETIKTIKNLGLRVEIIAYRHSLSHDIARESSAPVIYLDDLRSEIELIRPEVEDVDSLLASESET